MGPGNSRLLNLYCVRHLYLVVILKPRCIVSVDISKILYNFMIKGGTDSFSDIRHVAPIDPTKNVIES